MYKEAVGDMGYRGVLTNDGRAPFCQPCPSVRVIATTNAEYRLRTDGRTDGHAMSVAYRTLTSLLRRELPRYF